MKCKFCGGEEFYAHQVCRHDIVVDGDGNYIDDMNGAHGSSVYDSETPYGEFTCVTCGAEYAALRENAKVLTEPPFPYGQFYYRNWAPISNENGVIQATAPDSAYNVILEEKDGSFVISKIENLPGHLKLSPEYACDVLCDINIEMPDKYGAMLGSMEAAEWVRKLTSAIDAAHAIEAYVEHVNNFNK